VALCECKNAQDSGHRHRDRHVTSPTTLRDTRPLCSGLGARQRQTPLCGFRCHLPLLIAHARVGPVARFTGHEPDPPNDKVVFGAESFEAGRAFADRNQRQRPWSPTPPRQEWGTKRRPPTRRGLANRQTRIGEMRRHLLGPGLYWVSVEMLL
jgi:hypothetical protein